MRRAGLLNRLVQKRALQVAWCIFFVLNTVFLIVCAGMFSLFSKNDFYKDNGAVMRSAITQNLLIRDSDDAVLYFFLFTNLYRPSGTDFQNPENQQQMNKHLTDAINRFSEENTNYFFLIQNQGEDVFKNYTADESSLHYYADTKSLFNRLANRDLLPKTYSAESLRFEAHVKTNLTAHDDYWRVDRFFQITAVLRYAVLALLPVFSVLEVIGAYVLFRFSGETNEKEKRRPRSIDRIPLYVLSFLYIPIAVKTVDIFNNYGLRALDTKLHDLTSWFDIHGEAAGAFPTWSDICYDVYGALAVIVLAAVLLAVLAESLLETLGVRMKAPTWWHYSLLYRVLRLRNFEGLQVFFTVLTTIEILVCVWIYTKSGDAYRLLTCDILVTAAFLLLLYIVGRDVTVWITGTHRIAVRGSGYIPTANLSGETKKYAENINFLSRSANAQMEKRFINESFSTQLINGISGGLHTPLSAVAQNVERLQSGTLTEQEENACIEAINDLSRDLKKTIDDLILISKANAGNLPREIVHTQVGMMLDMFSGEYGGMFDEKGMSLVTEHPHTQATILADGQFMWYIFDGILNLYLQKAVRGTRVFLRAKYADGQATLLFQGCVRPNCMDGTDAFASDGGMGLPRAKVFTELQGGTFRHFCHRDILQIVLRFPLTQVLGKETADGKDSGADRKALRGKRHRTGAGL